MKRLISITLAIGLILLTPFYSGATSKTTTTITNPSLPKLPTISTGLESIISNSVPLTNVTDFDQKTLHTATQIQPYTFTLEEKDFATNQWQKYVTSIYVQATDINYIISILYADGSIMQSIVNSPEDLEKLYLATNQSNEEIKKNAAEKPDSTFTSFYKSIYEKKYELVYDDIKYAYTELGKYALAEKYPALLNKIYDSHQVYRKGLFYILTSSVYPSGNKVSYVSSSIANIEKQMNKLNDETAKLLIDNKLIKAPVVVAPVTVKYYAVVIFSNKTYVLSTFTTEAEAKAYLLKMIKSDNKAVVKVTKNADEANTLIKGLKPKK